MKLRLRSICKPILPILVIAMLGVGLACAGEKATPTSPPTATLAPVATATTAPTATLVPTATATLVPGVPTPTATLVPTATAVPTVTATAAPTATPRQSASSLTQLPGYKPEWGEPQRGGIMKLGLPQGPNEFRPGSGCTSAIFGPMCYGVFSSLLRYDPWVGMNSIIGDLAKSWELSGDGLTLTLKLEEGVKFHANPVVQADIRGDDFTCEDVQASIDYYLRPPEPRRTPGTRQLGHITGVSCPDGAKGYTAVISFNQVLAKTLGSLTKDLAMVDKGWIGWYVANHFDAMGTASPLSHSLATGTGPMVPLEYQPDVVAKLRRNPSYFREGLPLVDGMDNYILKDFTTRFTALATGQIHWFGSGSSSLLPGQVAQAERDFKDKIVLHSNLHTFPSGEAEFNMNRAPYNDRRVRQAINLTVSRDDWLLFKTAGTYPMARLVGYMEPYPDFYWGTPEEVLRTWPGIRQPKDQDIAEANRLLDEVFGKGKRFNTTCITRNAQNYMEYCLFFADQARKLGITVTMQPYELAVINTLTDVCNYDVYASVGTATTGDPDARLYRYSWAYEQVTGGKCALEGITAAEPALQAEIAAMIAAQTSEPDPVKRGEILRALDKKLTQELVHQIHYGWIKIFYGTAPNLKGYTLAGFPVFTYSIFERVWLAK